MSKVFTFRGLDYRSAPQAQETFVDNCRRKWRVLIVVGSSMEFSRRGMIEVTKVVAEPVRKAEVN